MKIAKWMAAGAGVAMASYATYAGVTWLRYGKVRPATGTETDALLDSFMPQYDVFERHAEEVQASPEVTLAAAKHVELDDSRIIRAIFKGRELILRSKPVEVERPRGLFAGMQAIGWGVLAETEREIVFGAVTKPWEANPTFRALPADEFAAFGEPGYVKIVWTLRADPMASGGSTFRTETRAVATDGEARAKFRRYWAFLSPGIIVIRMAMLPALKRAAEAHWRLEGDDILAAPRAQLTHAITINAPPGEIWPWLVQMGRGRGGWYSWDLLDNGGKRSADHIIPELQQLSVGDVLPWKESGPGGFTVLRIDPERALILGSSAPEFEGTWAFVLEPVDGDQTRLITRYRAAYPPSKAMSAKLPFISALHAFMERKQLRTIKHHAEHVSTAS